MADPAIPAGAGPFRRVVLKLSGESFAHTGERGIAMEEVVAIGTQICKAAQRALELEADILLKATRVDGVFSDDPEKNPHAMLYSELSYNSVREQNLRVMDSTAITQCMEHDMPILVFNYKKEGNIERATSGAKIGTLISSQVAVAK
jgi:uridylate kinase